MGDWFDDCQNKIIDEMVATDLFFEDYSDEDREEDWARGIHYGAYAEKVQLKDMKTSHILHCINKWNHLETSPLVEELDRRMPKQEMPPLESYV